MEKQHVTSEERRTNPPARPVIRGLTVRAWFLLALAALGTVTLAAAGLGVTVQLRTTRATDHLVDDIAPARTEAYQLESALLDQETGVRGYLLTGDQNLLEPYERGLPAQKRSRARLTRLLDGSAASRADLAALDVTVKAWHGDFAYPAVATGPDYGSAVSVTRGKKEFDRIRVRLNTLHQDLRQEQTDARAVVAHSRTRRDEAFLAVLVIFLLTGAAISVLLQFAVLRPLSALRGAARRVTDGDLEHHIRGSGPSDLRAVSHAVEDMRLRVVSELSTSRRNEAELARQAAELDAQAVELRRSNAELEQFAYVASHDLQEPLRKVASFCQLLEKRYADKLDDRGLQYIAFAVDGAKRMQTLINDLLTFSRVGRVQEHHGPVDLDATVNRALRNLAAAAEESGARVERPAGLPRVAGDPTRFAMVWQNLIGNGIKFRHEDRAPRIGIAVGPDPEADGFWRFTVTDNGIGIPAEFAEKVFVVFQRLHSRDSYEGTGIGLALCRKIIEHSGGRIWVDPEHTDGTRLAFTLPVLPDPPATGAADSRED